MTDNNGNDAASKAFDLSKYLARVAKRSEPPFPINSVIVALPKNSGRHAQDASEALDSTDNQSDKPVETKPSEGVIIHHMQPYEFGKGFSEVTPG